jgi:hypothetical protein
MRSNISCICRRRPVFLWPTRLAQQEELRQRCLSGYIPVSSASSPAVYATIIQDTEALRYCASRRIFAHPGCTPQPGIVDGSPVFLVPCCSGFPYGCFPTPGQLSPALSGSLELFHSLSHPRKAQRQRERVQILTPSAEVLPGPGSDTPQVV